MTLRERSVKPHGGKGNKPTPLDARHAAFLRLANEQHALDSGEAPQVVLGTVVRALALLPRTTNLIPERSPFSSA